MSFVSKRVLLTLQSRIHPDCSQLMQPSLRLPLRMRRSVSGLHCCRSFQHLLPALMSLVHYASLLLWRLRLMR